MKKIKKYNELKSKRSESKYVDYCEEEQMWGVFGSDSGFCYALFCDKTEADMNQ